ncbi:MAG TPA: energy transducer TonB [Polyangiaceae bacterium]|nr:energy transducer TonB [Polyangiaceae bacterium]
MTSSLETLEPGGGGLAEREEPLATVLGLGGREDRLVFVVALVAALAVHAVAGARALRVFPYLAELSALVRNGMQERLRSQVDIDLNEPPPPKPEPEPEPEPDPEPPPPAQQKAPDPAAPPPAAAEAGKVLTAEPDPDAPVDFGNEFVSGEGDHFAGGVTAAAGTSKKAVRDITAVPTGTGTGAPKQAPVVVGPDLSRTPSVVDKGACERLFPAEAEAEGINFMKVTIAVTVGADGRAKSVTVLKDPGFGFGKAARTCAMRMPYTPALSSAGKAIEQTFSFAVRFVR